MSPRAVSQATDAAADEPLEPELLRLIQALARAHAREDYAAAQAAAAAARAEAL